MFRVECSLCQMWSSCTAGAAKWAHLYFLWPGSCLGARGLAAAHWVGPKCEFSQPDLRMAHDPLDTRLEGGPLVRDSVRVWVCMYVAWMPPVLICVQCARWPYVVLILMCVCVSVGLWNRPCRLHEQVSCTTLVCVIYTQCGIGWSTQLTSGVPHSSHIQGRSNVPPKDTPWTATQCICGGLIDSGALTR